MGASVNQKQAGIRTSKGKSRTAPAYVLLAFVLLPLLGACGADEESVAEPIRPVRVVTVEKREAGETVSLTGQVQAQEEVSLSFRVGGRMLERPVNVGDRVEAGQVVARIDPEPARNALQTARANLADLGRQRIVERFSFDRNIGAYRELYATLGAAGADKPLVSGLDHVG